jgi:type VI secretion system protein ImpK
MSETPSDPESERTIIRPKPGGGRGAAPKPPAANPFEETDAERTVIRPQPAVLRAAARPAAPAEDAERTIIRPKPSGTAARPAAVPRPAPVARELPPEEPPQPPAEPPPIYVVGGNKLAAVAEPLVLLLARLWNAPSKPFQGNLRESTIEAFRVFEKRAREIGVPMEQLRPAHYALCAAIDDVVVNTPWGGAAGWDAGTLTANFHQEARAGERFFEQLGQLGRNAAKHLPVLELMYVCLSLGYMGSYRRRPDGVEAVDEVRRRTRDLILGQRAAAPEGLSARWAGVDAPYLPGKARFPSWVIVSAAVAVAAGLFAACMVTLNGASDEVYGRMLAAPPAVMPKITRAAIIVPPPPPPPAPEPTALDRLRDALKPELDRQVVALLGTPTAAVLRINTGTLFGNNNATFGKAAGPLLERVAAALRAELALAEGNAAVQVNAYTDNVPIRTVKFPSNFKLSAARADAVRDALEKAIGSVAGKGVKVAADGRADADPVAPNTTPDGREQNRRVEIVLRRQQ